MLPTYIRAKLAYQNAMVGTKGGTVTLSAVYEGNPKLQKISENAIFGDATPSGSLYLSGDFPVHEFIGNDSFNEYYVDIFDAGHPVSDTALFSFAAIKTYHAEADRNNPGYPRTVTLAAQGTVHGQLNMGIANPLATHWFEEHDNVVVSVSRVTGPRSVEEREFFEEAIAEAELRCRATYPKLEGTELEEMLNRWTYCYRRKLASE